MGMLPPLVATLIADTKEYTAKMDEAQAKMAEFGGASEATGAKMAGFASTASTAVLGVGVALGGLALEKAYSFSEAMDKLKNQAGLTDAQMKQMSASILATSSATGVSTGDLASAAIGIEQAGIRGKNAMDLLNAASQAAVVTNSSVANTTAAVVAAEKLRITSGMTMANVMGVLVAGSKNFTGGLAAETSMLSGRVGSALANYGLKLQQIIPIGQQFAAAGLPTRSISSFATGLGKINAPIEVFKKTSKGTTETMSTYAVALEHAGLSVTHLQTLLRTGDIPGLLLQIRDAAARSHEPLSQLVNLVFGTGGGAAASVLIKNLQQLTTSTNKLKGAGAGSLTSGFEEAMKQIGPQIAKLKAQFDAALISGGQLLLPYFSKAVGMLNDTFRYFQTHPLEFHIAAGALGAVLGGALLLKMSAAGVALASAFGIEFTAWASVAWAGYGALLATSFVATLWGLDWLKKQDTVKPSAKLAPWLQELLTKAGIPAGATTSLSATGIKYLENKYHIYPPKVTVVVKPR